MKVFVAVWAMLVAAAAAVSPTQLLHKEWETFKMEHGKTYSTPTEEMFRFKVFLQNKDKIASHNMRAAAGQHTFTLAMNQFGDMLSHEFRQLNGFKGKPGERTNTLEFMAPANLQVPKSIDWRTKGYVTHVKNQGQCGSCWAFSATGSLEGQHFRKTGKLVSLSEQNLVDCSKNFGNNGCEGGLMEDAFKYVKANHGIDTEKSYPYMATDEKCMFKNSSIGSTDNGFVEIKQGNEGDLATATATVGPISIAIDAGLDSFMFYHSGVYYDQACSQNQLDHGVLAVGYGESADGKYWIVKNSWGKDWGEDGYIRMAKDRGNMCGIASMASYPLV